MPEIDELEEGVLNECFEDDVGLWSVVWDVRHRMLKATDSEIRDIAMRIVGDLLGSQKIWPGHPTKDGRGFVYWDMSPMAAIKKISDEWDRLGREPNVGEVVWFTAKKNQAA